MKLALTFCLLAIAIASSQRFLAPRPADTIFWTPPYLSPRLIYNDDHLFPYNDYHYTDGMQRNRHVLYNGQALDYNQVQEQQVLDADGVLNSDNYFGTQQYRNKNKFAFGPIETENPSAEGRFFFFNTAVISNPFLKTATYTLTSSVALTSIRSCIPVANFAVGAAVGGVVPTSTAACRKRRNLFGSAAKDVQNSISPSQQAKLEPTSLFDASQDIDPYVGQRMSHEIASSKDDISANADWNSSHSGTKRVKRFFLFNYIVTTTVTTYAITSTTSVKTVELGVAKSLLCLPAGYVIC